MLPSLPLFAVPILVLWVRLQKHEKEKRSAKPEKVLLYHSHTICSPSSSFMGGVAKTEKTKKRSAKPEKVLPTT